MKRLLVWIVAVLILLAPTAATAADTADLADQAGFRHYAVEEGAPVDTNAMERLIGDLPASPVLYFIALADDPSDGADIVARDILNALPGGTLVVVAPSDLGAVSTEFSDATLNEALDASIDLFDTSYVDGFRAFAEELVTATVVVTTTAAPESSGGGGTGILIPVVLIGGVVLLVLVLTRRGRKSDEKIQHRRLTEARAEIKTQLDTVANRILELSDQVSVADDDEATGHYRSATATFDEVQGAFEKAQTLADLEQLSDRLDTARWELEAADAITEGRPVPPEPEDHPAACFFDPNHRGGIEEASITTPAGSKTVSVCHDCAERLRRGEQPKPRDIIVNGRRVPAPMAPRSHGGGGFDWMNVFQMVVAGMGTAAQYRNRSPRRRMSLPLPTRSPRRATATRSPKPTRSITGRARRRRR